MGAIIHLVQVKDFGPKGLRARHKRCPGKLTSACVSASGEGFCPHLQQGAAVKKIVRQATLRDMMVSGEPESYYLLECSWPSRRGEGE